ncbi:LytR/AlgR family response regulator transcription factor [Flaviaesturariibacter aridisoli]|uniref:Response regulator transcription factor n=1 Tax=Flaviaesturariibacter aridisoli TaxID=2545761 RepID=A0A4R4EA74_9BACT|nr:LytTR family DNA-binding domain-containing protein [Flaviaesturariibacter aridisoli]TCZ74725.1 response regulator transcription factor [Flaviaesturariibacter aridisoli]
MIRCMIIDDEQHAIDILEHYVKQAPYLELVGTSTHPIEALQEVASGKVDLVFLDIQMPELSGLDFIKAINGKAKVILTTAYPEFALEGYELDVVDYLLKPVRLPRFLQAVQKAMTAVQPAPAAAATDVEDDYLFVKTESKGKLLKINLDDIDYIEGMKNYVAIHRGAQKTLVYTSMKELEERLPQRRFLRVHKSFIIPLGRITGIEGNLVRLQGVQAEILIGDNYKAELMELIRNKMIR